MTKTPSILALDSCTEICSVALLHQGQLYSETNDAARDHSQNLLPMVDRLLDQAKLKLKDLDAIALTAGPGSFTGVRICTSVVQGLAYGAQVPVIQLSTLATLAQDRLLKNPQLSQIYCAIDARMNEVYYGHYKVSEALVVLQGEEAVLAPDVLNQNQVSLDASAALAGTGFLNYAEALSNFIEPSEAQETLSGALYPLAEAMLPLAQAALTQGNLKSAASVCPVYLRNDVAWKKQPKQS
jgi:tRNA threonylcarbamoyladenosine biosynthesis protein TsaB